MLCTYLKQAFGGKSFYGGKFICEAILVEVLNKMS